MELPSLVFGCLPVIVDIQSGKDPDRPDCPCEYWSEISQIWWRKRDGLKGKQFSEALFRRAIDVDYYNIDFIAWENYHQLLHEEKQNEDDSSCVLG